MKPRQLRSHRRFEKEFQKLTPNQSNPHYPPLRNHALRGSFQGQRAISVSGDIRIIFEEEDKYQRVTFLRIGTHNQVY